MQEQSFTIYGESGNTTATVESHQNTVVIKPVKGSKQFYDKLREYFQNIIQSDNDGSIEVDRQAFFTRLYDLLLDENSEFLKVYPVINRIFTLGSSPFNTLTPDQEKTLPHTSSFYKLKQISILVSSLYPFLVNHPSRNDAKFVSIHGHLQDILRMRKDDTRIGVTQDDLNKLRFTVARELDEIKRKEGREQGAANPDTQMLIDAVWKAIRALQTLEEELVDIDQAAEFKEVHENIDAEKKPGEELADIDQAVGSKKVYKNIDAEKKSGIIPVGLDISIARFLFTTGLGSFSAASIGLIVSMLVVNASDPIAAFVTLFTEETTIAALSVGIGGGVGGLFGVAKALINLGIFASKPASNGEAHLFPNKPPVMD